MSKNNLAALILSLCFFSIPIFAQSNELSLSVGGVFATDQILTTTTLLPIPCLPTNPGCNIFTSHFTSSPGVAFMGNFARRITAFGPASLYVEAPVVGEGVELPLHTLDDCLAGNRAIDEGGCLRRAMGVGEAE